MRLIRSLLVGSSLAALVGIASVTRGDLAVGAAVVEAQSVAAAGRVPPMVQGVLPPDVNPESRNRLPPLRRDALDERQQANYDAAMKASGGKAPEGVAAIRLYRSGLDVRWDSPLGRQLTELTILVGAREHDQPYEWSLHEMEALSVGLAPRTIDVVRRRLSTNGLSDREAVIVQLGREVSRDHMLSSSTYARALAQLGQTNLVDIVDLLANYSGTAANLTAANQWLPPQMKQFLPLPFTPPDDIDPLSRSRIPMPTVRAAGGESGAQGQGGPGAGAGSGGAVPVASGGVGLYRRTLAPPPTGPGSMGRFAAGLKSLEGSIGRPLMSLAVLVTAREHNQQYDWTMAEVEALQSGLAPATVDVIRHRRPLTGLSEKEAAIAQFGRELFSQHYVTPQTYATALGLFGLRDLSDIVTGLMAQHARDAVLLTAFDQHLPVGQKPLLPVSRERH
jgi:alkylhydroperoxidase family enzyme